ncbi:MAG TPA: O-antigen ligase family protein [Gaiellaceae bacterium]|nr:O-antigen ligase family protein [Gaiellaceae bacterium]
MAVVPLAFFDGGYFPTAWGVPALVGLWIATVAVSLAPTPLSRHEAVALAALGALLGWSALSFLWSDDRPQTVLEVERLTIYVAGLAALLFVARRQSVPWLLGGTATAIVVACGAGLAELLFQDLFGRPEARIRDVGALHAPVGYSNALGGLSAIGVLILVGFLAQARRPFLRSVAAAAGVVLLAALTLSLSRGAWLGLVTGAVVAVCLAPRRVAFSGWLLVLGLPGTALLALALRADALLTRGASEAAAVREGHRLALAIVALAAGAALLAAFGPRLVARARAATPTGRAAGGLLLLGALALGAAALWATEPDEPAGAAPRAAPRVSDPTQRVLHPSVGRRERLWEAAWNDFEAHPVHGSGSGTFGRYWLEHRTVGRFVRDAHSLYLETLAEVGLVGLILLLVALAAPVASAVGARGEPLVPATLGAYSVYAVQAGVDWLWEMPVPTTAALACGAALLVAGRPASSRRLTRPARVGVAGLALALGALSFVALIGNNATASSERALAAGKLEQAETHARRATTWLPWAAEPWLVLARTQRRSGDRRAARESLDRALELDPGNWLLWYERGLAVTGAERRRSFARASRLNPRDMRQLVGRD